MNAGKKAFAVVLLCALAFGCGESQKSQTTQPLCSDTENKSKIIEAAEKVLTGMYFTIDKADADAGIIRTRPLPAAQFFEFWRSDSVGEFNQSEANLHTIRRTVEMQIEEQKGKLCINCVAATQRLSFPSKRLTSSTQVYEMFTISGPTSQRFRLYPEQQKDMAWINLGRDSALETEILNRLNKKLTQLK
jgi:hypothetical protein